MTFDEITTKITAKFGDSFLEAINGELIQPSVTVSTTNLIELCQFLQQTESLYFDYLACLSAIDNGEQADTM